MVERDAVRRGLYIAGPAAVVWIAVTLLLIPSVSPLEVPPCPPFSYSVSYASPFCNVTFLAHTGPVNLARLWWAAPWNGVANGSVGTGYERASDHVNVTPTSDHPVAVWDRDGDGNLTQGDVLETWAPGGCGGNFMLWMGETATSLTSSSALRMEAGYQWTCGGGETNYVFPILIGGVVALLVAMPLAFMLRRSRRKERR